MASGNFTPKLDDRDNPAVAKLTERCVKIAQEHAKLADILERHSHTLTQAWDSRKSKATRGKFLKNAWRKLNWRNRAAPWDSKPWPAMASKSRPHLRGKNPTREHLLWPHLNAEDLADRPDTFLKFCANRAEYQPWEYANQDLLSTRVMWSEAMWPKGLATKPKEGHSVTVSFDRRKSTSTSGKYFSLWEFPVGCVAHCTTMTFPQALLVAEVQELIYTFLVEACLRILQATGIRRHKYDDNARYPKQLPQVLRVGELPLGSGRLGKTFVERRLLEFYGPPAEMALRALQSIFKQQDDLCRGVLRSLLWDPTYYESSVCREAKMTAAILTQYEHEASLAGDDGIAPFNRLRLYSGPDWPSTSWNPVRKSVTEALDDAERWFALRKVFDTLKAAIDKTTSAYKLSASLTLFVQTGYSPLQQELFNVFLHCLGLMSRRLRRLSELLLAEYPSPRPKHVEKTLAIIARADWASSTPDPLYIQIDGLDKVIMSLDEWWPALSDQARYLGGSLIPLAETLALLDSFHPCSQRFLFILDRRNRRLHTEAETAFAKIGRASLDPYKSAGGALEETWEDAVRLGEPWDHRFGHPVHGLEGQSKHDRAIYMANLADFRTPLTLALGKKAGELSPAVREALELDKAEEDPKAGPKIASQQGGGRQKPQRRRWKWCFGWAYKLRLFSAKAKGVVG